MARMMLALILYFLIVALSKAYDAGVDIVFPHSCPVKGLLEVYDDMVEILLMLQVFLGD